MIIISNTHVEVDALDPVCLAGPGLAGDDVDEGGDELDCELQHGGEEAAILLGLEAQLAVLSLDAVAEVSAGRGPELAGKLLRGVTANSNRYIVISISVLDMFGCNFETIYSLILCTD